MSRALHLDVYLDNYALVPQLSSFYLKVKYFGNSTTATEAYLCICHITNILNGQL
jgi:hypothetical protein